MYRIIDDKKYIKNIKKVLTILNYNDIVLLVLKKRTKQVRKKTKKVLTEKEKLGKINKSRK